MAAPSAYVTDDPALAPSRYVALVRGLIEAGVRLIGVSGRRPASSLETVIAGCRAAAAAQRRGAAHPAGGLPSAHLVLDGHPEEALSLDLDGVHLRAGGKRVRRARDLLGPERWIILGVTALDGVAAIPVSLVDVIVYEPPREGPRSSPGSRAPAPADAPRSIRGSESAAPVFGAAASPSALSGWARAGVQGVALGARSLLDANPSDLMTRVRSLWGTP